MYYLREGEGEGGGEGEREIGGEDEKHMNESTEKASEQYRNLVTGYTR